MGDLCTDLNVFRYQGELPDVHDGSPGTTVRYCALHTGALSRISHCYNYRTKKHRQDDHPDF